MSEQLPDFDPFELLGVFEGQPGPDHERLNPVEFSGLPDLGVEGLLRGAAAPGASL